MGDVVALQTKCPLCDGKGNVEYFDSGYCTTMVTMCSMCKGTGKRPSEIELQRRRTERKP